MIEIILQTWSDSNMAGDEWRWEVYATSNGPHWSIKARQIDEITGKIYRVRGAYRLKTAQGVVDGLDRIFSNDLLGDVGIVWDCIVWAFRQVSPSMACAIEDELEEADLAEQARLNPKPTPESRRRDLINQWIHQSNYPKSDSPSSNGMLRVVINGRRHRAIFKYVETYFDEHGCFPTGEHHVDVVLEDLSQSVRPGDGLRRNILEGARSELNVVFPTDT